MISLTKKLVRGIRDMLYWFCEYWYPALIVFFALTIVFCFIASTIQDAQTDVADPTAGRSGMYVYTDKLTSCQYLGKDGAITPRLNNEGKQICLKK